MTAAELCGVMAPATTSASCAPPPRPAEAPVGARVVISPGRARPRASRVTATAARCAYCHGPFGRADAPFSCTSCETLLHDPCWREARRCPSLGCRGPAARGFAARTPAPAHSTSARRAVAVGLHALALALWTFLGCASVLRPAMHGSPLTSGGLVFLGVLVLLWWSGLLLHDGGAARRLGAWVETDGLLMGSGLVASLALVIVTA